MIYEPLLSRIKQAISESTCQKRVTVCVIMDANWNVLSIGSNRCDPEGGTCHRLGISQDKSNYDTHSHCNWTHAEIRAIETLKEGAEAYEAVLYGHDFYCNGCEEELRKVGVRKFTVSEITIDEIKQAI